MSGQISVAERVKADLERLASTAEEMRLDLQRGALGKNAHADESAKAAVKKAAGSFQRNYQAWYTEACAVVKHLIPDRLQEFKTLYEADPRRKTITQITYTIQDWLNGIRASTDYIGKKHFEDAGSVLMRFQTQVAILDAGKSRYESSLFDIRKLLQADLFDSELGAARELLRNGYNRAAGAMAGVVLESHFIQVAADHAIAIKKKNPTIADLNDLLKEQSVTDIPVWRSIQRLADLRNLADHKKTREPTADEMEELIAGTDKCLKTIV